jgi:D-2-hydroxyacid dehydrogenase (NADP+)
MKIATFLTDDEADSLHFDAEDLAPLKQAFPKATIRHHQTSATFLEDAKDVDIVLTWHFEADWYRGFPDLTAIYTPAAGGDWVAEDPSGSIPVIHGSFHGPILAESLLSALLFMNHRMPAMIRNHQARQWDRKLQGGTRLLATQTILIIGMGNIGSYCANLLRPLAGKIIGVRQQADENTKGVSDLPQLLPNADHVILLLPGIEETNRFMNKERLAQMKQGSYIYNFGRGNSLHAEDLIPALDCIAGAFLDVTEIEPLPADSALWKHEKVFITPHSSCMYEDYTERYMREVISQMTRNSKGLLQ